MNFLAHALLGESSAALRIGGLAGDFVKGPLPAGLPPDLSAGVALHRAIDSYSDRHPAFLASRARVSALRRRYSGVLVDMFYDHLLARSWERYSSETLEEFARCTYALAAERLAQLPERFGPVFEAMRGNDWLCAYREAAAIGRALDRMALHRARRPNPLAGAGGELIGGKSAFEQDFHAFFPDVRSFAGDWIAARRASQ